MAVEVVNNENENRKMELVWKTKENKIKQTYYYNNRRSSEEKHTVTCRRSGKTKKDSARSRIITRKL